MTRQWLFGLLIFSTLMGVRAAWAADRPSIHGMLVFGKSTVYLSHLPMFHSPHDYQVIVEVELQGSALSTYLADQQANPGQTLYTLEPLEQFVLPDEIQGLKSFQATLYRGHFERGGIPIAAGITVKIKSIVYFNHFDPAAAKPKTLTYLLFGHPDEMFLAHWIVAKPDFDQILGVDPSSSLQLTKSPYTWVQFSGESDTQPLPSTTPSFKEYYLELGDLSE